MKKITKVLLAVVLMTSLVACQNKEGSQGNDKGAEIALITDVGTIDDGSFNEGSFNGVKAYGEEHGVTYDYYRPIKDETEAYYEEIVKAIEDGGAKVVVTPGFLFAQAVQKAQHEFPDVHFVFVDGVPATIDEEQDLADNTYSILYEEQQAGFLAGYAAVKDGYRKLGFIGGLKIPAVERFGIGFVYGAELAAQELGETVEMHYNYSGKFEAAPEVKTLAAGWYAGGTEIIFTASGGANASVFAAAEETDGKVIGVDVDQYGDSETVVTSALKELELSVYEALEAHYKGEFPGGTIYSYGVEDDGIGLSDKFDRFENFTKDDYEEIYSRLKENKDGLRESIPTQHKDDFSDHDFKHVELILN